MNTALTPEYLELTRRFFRALDTLRERGDIRGVNTFVNRYNIESKSLRRSKDHVSRIKPDWLIFLCRDYGISTQWLLLGQGRMFREQPTKYNHENATLHFRSDPESNL